MAPALGDGDEAAAASAEFVQAWNDGVERFVKHKKTAAWMERIWQLQSEGVPKMLDELVRLPSWSWTCRR